MVDGISQQNQAIMIGKYVKIKKYKTINLQQLGELIGKGAIGEVYKALDSETAKTVAIKRIDLMSISAENIRSIESEVNLLKKLDHPNIVKYIEYIQTKKHINIIFICFFV